MKNIIIIPSKNPENNLLNYIDLLLKENFCEIIVVNDGSGNDREYIFDEIKKKEKCIVLSHEKNMGKGAALKTAFSFLNNNRNDIIGAVTVDDDSQHDINDVKKIAQSIRENYIILGERKFDAITPIKSRIGNKISSFTLNILHKIKLEDTQTGLRGFSSKQFSWLTKIGSNGFDYEVEVLIKSKPENLKLITIPIKTIYENNNKLTRYKPIYDSLTIMIKMLKK